MRIHVGCGRHVLNGWTNCDIQASPKASRPPDILCDARSIPVPDGCATEVMALHVIEHFARYDADAALAEWNRIMQVGGKLTLELPNLEAACRNLLAGMDDQMAMWPIYGNWNECDPYMLHKHGYTPTTIKSLLEGAGFKHVKVLPPQTHGRRANRDMRVEAIKA